MPDTSPKFDFDAMLMFGWVADADYRIRSVNASLNGWMKLHAAETLQAIESDGSVSIDEFFGKILQLPPAVHAEIVRRLRVIPENIQKLPESQDALWGDAHTEIKNEIRMAGKNHLLIGVRAVAVGGFAMASKVLEDRVDLIIVCHTAKDEESGRWKVTGYQGQLQNAWLRVGPIVQQGTRSGSFALMGRNLSHNIGSHALYWMEQDMRGNAAVSPTLSRFFRYLRERMELVAGFVTSMPLSPRTMKFGILVSEFEGNTELTSRLCRSEGVTAIKLDVRKESLKERVSIPGGTIGMQAFHSILENIIRDCAKYGKHVDTMHVNIQLEKIDEGPWSDYLRVRVSDVCLNEPQAESALHRIEAALSDLRIADENGSLQEGFWGVKERFIAAALLRGIRVEELALSPENGDTNAKLSDLNLNRVKAGQPRILSVVNAGNSIAWEFYLLKGKDVLVISDQLMSGGGADSGFDLRTMQWLRENISRDSEVRHRFVVLMPDQQEDLQWILANRACFPYRTFLGGRFNGSPEVRSDLVSLDESTPLADRFASEILYRQWLDSLDPTLEKRFILVKNVWGWHKARWNSDTWEKIQTEGEYEEQLKSPDCLGLIHRHWKDIEMAPKPPMHYEAYVGFDSLDGLVEAKLDATVKYALFESALIRVLIVDERIDAKADEAVSDPQARGWTVRSRYQRKGIEIHGKEYSERSIQDKSLLMGWATEHGRNAYHFVCIHRGILDKLETVWGQKIGEVCAELRQTTPNLLIHSGRAGIIPHVSNVRFVPLSNVEAWMHSARGKWEVVEELCLVRKTWYDKFAQSTAHPRGA